MRFSRITRIALCLLLMASVAVAATPTGPKRKARPARTNPEDSGQKIDINNISMVVKNTGSFAFDTENGASGLEFPKGTGKFAVFAAGFWMGALVNGDVRVSVAEYSDDYRPGSAAGGTPDDPAKPEYKVYKLNRVYLDATGAIDAATRDAVLADYVAGAVPHGAPPVSVLPDGSLSIIGDQMMWSVYNDLGKDASHNGASSQMPLNIEVQQTTFAFSRQGPLGNTVFMKYKIINRGTQTLTDAYVSQWSDPDLGGATDDLVGCDTTLSVGFVYNATNNDEQYANQAPCVGYDFLQGPRVPITGPNGAPNGIAPSFRTLGLASFNKYPNGAGPADSTETYNFMKGLNGDGSPLIDPTTNQPTPFNVSGDPVTNRGFLDSAPSDRRLMLSSGPFTMAPGDEQEVVVGIVVAQGTSRLASVALMKCFDAAVQAAYDVNFNLPSPPNNPVVSITPRDGEVFIKWDSGSENYNQAPYNWEGYNVYQGASIAGPWTRVATYDRVNGTGTVLDVECDPNSPVPLQKVKAFGTDAGVRYSVELTGDAVRGGPLLSAQRYFYTVTAYSVGIGEFQQVLESAFSPVAVVPQTPPAGVDLSAAGVSDITHTLLPAPLGTKPSTDVVTLEVMDPASVTTADWKVGFKPNGASSVWYLVRTQGAEVDTVINNWPNFSGDENFPVVDGIRVRIKSYPLGELADISYADTTGGSPAAVGGAFGRGLPFFGGAGDYGANYPGGGTLPPNGHYGNVMIRFGPPFQKAYRYVRGDADAIADYVDVPFSVWDTDTNTQLNVIFREEGGTALEDGTWDPNDSGNGGREPIWVLDSPYTGVSDPLTDPYFTDPAKNDMGARGLDLRYTIYPRLTSAGATPDPGDKILFTTSVPASQYDEFTFTTTAPNSFDASLAKGELSKIRAVPNPYFAHSTYELNRFNRVLKFTHLPARCTVRIFNLAGDLVRVMDKNDGTSQLTWDLNTASGLPVGSGVYIFHVDAPGVGTTTGKVAVFMEKERLNNF